MSSDCGRKPEFRNSTAVFAHSSVDPCFFLYRLTFNPDLPPKTSVTSQSRHAGPAPLFSHPRLVWAICVRRTCAHPKLPIQSVSSTLMDSDRFSPLVGCNIFSPIIYTHTHIHTRRRTRCPLDTDGSCDISVVRCHRRSYRLPALVLWLIISIFRSVRRDGKSYEPKVSPRYWYHC